MATEYRDGTFSDTKPLEEAFEDFQKAVESGTARALHVGTPEEIEKVKSEKDISKQIDDLNQRLKSLEADASFIVKPSDDEIKQICGPINTIEKCNEQRRV